MKIFKKLRHTLHLLSILATITGSVRAQWKAEIPIPADTAGVYDLRVSVKDPNVAWGIMTHWLVDEESYIPYTNEFLPIVKTSDGGETWERKKLSFGFAPFPCSIYGLDAAHACVSGVDANFNNFVMLTTDGGNTWGRINDEAYRLPTSYVNAVYFYDEMEGVALGDPAKRGVDTVLSFEIYTIKNRGKIWERIAPEFIPRPDLNELGGPGFFSFVGDEIWFGTIDYSTGEHHRIFHSADRGKHWTAKRASYSNIYFVDSKNGLAYSTEHLTITNDGGDSWEQLFLPNNNYINSAGLTPDSLHIIISFRDKNISGPFETWRSKDKGRHWGKIDSTENLGSIRFAENGNGYAGEFQPLDHPTKMYTYKYTGTNANKSFYTTEKLLISPNVASDEVKVYFPTGMKSGKIHIFDLSGKELFNNKINQTEASATVYIKQLNPGIYVIKYVSGIKTAIGKFIKT